VRRKLPRGWQEGFSPSRVLFKAQGISKLFTYRNYIFILLAGSSSLLRFKNACNKTPENMFCIIYRLSLEEEFNE